MLALPAQAQDGSSRVSFDGIGFTFDHTLGKSVNILTVRAQRPDSQQFEVPDAAHIAFVPYGRRAESAKVPRVFDAPGVVRFYRVADLSGYELATGSYDQLQKLLTDRPDLATYMAITGDGFGDELPHLPLFGAGQAIRARAAYVDTPQLSGVAYVAAFRQDVSPFDAGDFWYLFQGLSADGTWYVSVSWKLLETSLFPRHLSAREQNRQAKRWTRYLKESLTNLNGAAPAAFTPTLTSLDALVRSITFEDIPATESSPLPGQPASPVPSPAVPASPAA